MRSSSDAAKKWALGLLVEWAAITDFIAYFTEPLSTVDTKIGWSEKDRGEPLRASVSANSICKVCTDPLPASEMK